MRHLARALVKDAQGFFTIREEVPQYATVMIRREGDHHVSSRHRCRRCRWSSRTAEDPPPAARVTARTVPDCKAPGIVVPIVDRSRCEAKGDCVEVCPYDVFEVRALATADKAGLSLFSRLKARAHGNRQAFVVRDDECHACGKCVAACPERAIRLSART